MWFKISAKVHDLHPIDSWHQNTCQFLGLKVVEEFWDRTMVTLSRPNRVGSRCNCNWFAVLGFKPSSIESASTNNEFYHTATSIILKSRPYPQLSICNYVDLRYCSPFGSMLFHNTHLQAMFVWSNKYTCYGWLSATNHVWVSLHLHCYIICMLSLCGYITWMILEMFLNLFRYCLYNTV